MPQLITPSFTFVTVYEFPRPLPGP